MFPFPMGEDWGEGVSGFLRLARRRATGIFAGFAIVLAGAEWRQEIMRRLLLTLPILAAIALLIALVPGAATSQGRAPFHWDLIDV